MMVDCDISSFAPENISQHVTLVPRIVFSHGLLDTSIEYLLEKQDNVKQSNKILFSEFEETESQYLSAIILERTITISLEALFCVRKRLASISDIRSIPDILPSIIPMIRTISAQLFEILPQCSQKLCELSVQLGSIVLDSATLTKARFDFSEANAESTVLLDKVKLIVDSKISKQHPNLDFNKE